MKNDLKKGVAKISILAAIVSVAGVGCNGGGGGGSDSGSSSSGGSYSGGSSSGSGSSSSSSGSSSSGGSYSSGDSSYSGESGYYYSQAWYDVYGYYCGSGDPRAGCNFYWDGSKIQDWEDPYYSSYYNLEYATWYYTDTYGYSRDYTGWAWLSPDGVLYDDWGYALNEDNEEGSRDSLAEVAEQEDQVATTVGKSFAKKYALAETTGVSIARTLQDWATLSKRRARTNQDIADFSKRLYGVSLDTAVAALASAQAGDVSGVVAVNDQIASFWGTDPETSKTILKNWYKDQLAEAGL